MGVQLTGLGSTTAIAADATFQAIKLCPRAMESISWSSYAGTTGTMVAASANWNAGTGAGGFFCLRNTGPNYIAVRKVQFGMRMIAGITTGAFVDYGLVIARNYNFSPAPTPTLINLYSANGRLKSGPSPNATISIATTAVFTTPAPPYTKVYDTNLIGYVNAFAQTTTIAALIPPSTVMFESLPGEMPILLRANEGIEMVGVTNPGTGGTWTGQVIVEFAEVPIATFMS